MEMDIKKAIVAGVVGTVVMTVVGLHVAPIMGLPPMNPANMLAGQMGGSMLAGWAAHFMIGIVLALGFGAVAGKLPGPPAVQGAVYGLAPWLMAMLIVMPMMGMPMFGGAAPMAIGSLVGHLVYGATVGAIYGGGSSSS
jgi:uncharacterized membrane protein YagU involved in acid resistance